MTRQPLLSVVLPTLGNYELLRRVLDGYNTQTAPAGSFELIVVADRADPDPAAVDAAIGKRRYPVRRLSGRIAGLSASRNAGWEAARADIVLFTANDALPRSGLVSEHLRWHEAYPARHIGVLGHVGWAPGLHVTPFMAWLDRGIGFAYGRIEGTDAEPGRFCTANASVKRAFLERVGGFEEGRLPHGLEGIEWAYRASRRGFLLMYARRAVVDRLRPTTLDLWKKRARRLGAAERRLVELHPELEPRMRSMFEQAAARPPSRGRAVRLYRWVPPRIPWLGPGVHTSTDLHFKQALAPEFLAGWRGAASGPGGAGA